MLEEKVEVVVNMEGAVGIIESMIRWERMVEEEVVEALVLVVLIEGEEEEEARQEERRLDRA
jgi:hypothetical protein